MASLKQMISIDPRSNLNGFSDKDRARIDKLLRGAALEVAQRSVVTAEWYCSLDEDERGAIGAALDLLESRARLKEKIENQRAQLETALQQLRALTIAKTQMREAMAQGV